MNGIRKTTFYETIIYNNEVIAKVFFCGSTSSPRTEKVNDFNLSPFTLSLSKGKLRTFAIGSNVIRIVFQLCSPCALGFGPG
jgi:hypothetical protein